MGQNALFEKYGRVFKPKEHICREGETGKEMYLILDGVVVVYKGTDMKTIARLGAGDFFGEMSLLENLPRFASVQAVSEVKVLVINLHILEQYVAINPGFGITMLKKFSGRLRKYKLYEKKE